MNPFSPRRMLVLTSVALGFKTVKSQTLKLLNGQKSSSPDLVGGSNGAECKMRYTDLGYGETLACDFDTASFLYG